ncbi:MAG: hypothetical protein HOY79_03200 [Streptomyces sp.]|nr:hypothetical protein [Streptomyces sp.]
MSAPPIDAARAWLASGEHDAAHAYRWWENHPDGVAIMPLGALFDAVEVPAPLSSRLLPHPAIGPAFTYADTQQLYVLVQAGTADDWPDPRALCLGEGHYLSVPDPSRRGPDGAYWLQPPDGTGALTDPAALLAALDEAASWLDMPGMGGAE